MSDSEKKMPGFSGDDPAAGHENRKRPEGADLHARRPRLSIGSWHMPLPRSKWLRILIGLLFILFGTLGFLPILGFWMIPVGLIVLSHDSAYIRRRRRRLAVWWQRRRRKRRDSRPD